MGGMTKASEDSGRTASTVLVVDDEPDIRFLLKITLERSGYNVIEASHGEAALELVRVSRPALVITDRMMPRMDGTELITTLRGDEGTSAIPIIMLTGTNGPQVGADALMTKPFELQALIELVASLIGEEH